MSDDTVSLTLERTITRYREAIRRVGARHGLSGADLEEILQEVRLRLWRALGSDEKIAAVAASYLYRTAASAALDLIRRRRARPGDSIEGGEVAEQLMISKQPSATELIDSNAAVAEIAASVASLPSGRREVVRMYLAGYGREEIAALLGWTEAKTRNLLYRGLDNLRQSLTAKGIGAT